MTNKPQKQLHHNNEDLQVLLFTILKAAVESNIKFEMYVGSKTEDNGEYDDEDHAVED